MKNHEPAYPATVGSLGFRAVVPSTQAMAKSLQQTELSLGLRRADEMRQGYERIWNFCHGPTIASTGAMNDSGQGHA
jgi:hypothetical protein